MSEEKSLPPTKRKLKKARQEGKTLKSQLVTQTIAALGALSIALLLAKFSWVRSIHLVEYISWHAFSEPLLFARRLFSEVLFVVLGALVGGALLSVLVDGLQVGFSFQPLVLKPRSSRLSLTAGWKRIFEGIKGAWQPLLRCVVFCVTLAFFYSVVLERVVSSAFAPLSRSLEVILINIFSLFGMCAGLFLLFSGIEFIVNRKKYLKELSMSHQEYRREMKDDEGDPHIRSFRKSLHESILHEDLVRRVKSSKVIIVKKRNKF